MGKQVDRQAGREMCGEVMADGRRRDETVKETRKKESVSLGLGKCLDNLPW